MRVAQMHGRFTPCDYAPKFDPADTREINRLATPIGAETPRRFTRYMLTVDEFLSWQDSVDRYGLAGLRSTRIQQYRQK
jgi:hypothetical protein